MIYSAVFYVNIDQTNIIFQPANSATYKEVCVPYWTKEKITAGASLDQECILQLDVWVVHCSIAFHTWLDSVKSGFNPRIRGKS
ncbi:hypothetical protein BS17DRAFT_709145 [Gyrodon lividus]|nr:hypothetical protein BS17DRAFT_709145 [Gyrodon lividus]